MILCFNEIPQWQDRLIFVGSKQCNPRRLGDTNCRRGLLTSIDFRRVETMQPTTRQAMQPTTLFVGTQTPCPDKSGLSPLLRGTKLRSATKQFRGLIFSCAKIFLYKFQNSPIISQWIEIRRLISVDFRPLVKR